MTDSLSHINIISHKVEEGQKYRICSEKITKECIGAGDKKDFKKNVCRNCYNFKYLMKKKEKEGKVLLTDNNLNKDEIISLFQSLTSLQLIKLSGLLTSQQQSVFQTKNFNTYNCDSNIPINKSSNTNKHSCHNIHLNKFSNINTSDYDNIIVDCKLENDLSNLDNSDNNSNINSVNSTNTTNNNSFSKSSNSSNSTNNSPREVSDNSPTNSPNNLPINSSKLQTNIKPTLKIISSH